MKYTEFLKQPAIINDFNSKFQELKLYFQKQFEKVGFSKEQNNVVSTKIALINTDHYFSELFENESPKIEKSKAISNN